MNKKIFILIGLIILSSLVYSERRKNEIVCLNKKKVYIGVKVLEFQVKNIGKKRKRFHLGMEVIDLKLRRMEENRNKGYEENKDFYKSIFMKIVPDILMTEKNPYNTETELNPGEIKKIKWIVPYETNFKENRFFYNEDKSPGYECHLFIWYKDPFEKKNRIEIYKFRIMIEKIKPDFNIIFNNEKECLACLNKKNRFVDKEIVYFKLKNKCNKRIALDFAVMAYDKQGKLTVLSCVNDLKENGKMRDLSYFQPNEEKIIFWNVKYAFLYDYKGLKRFDKIKNGKVLKNKKYYLYVYLYDPYKKQRRKKIFEFMMER